MTRVWLAHGGCSPCDAVRERGVAANHHLYGPLRELRVIEADIKALKVYIIRPLAEIKG